MWRCWIREVRQATYSGPAEAWTPLPPTSIPGRRSIPGRHTFLEAIMLGDSRRSCRRSPRLRVRRGRGRQVRQRVSAAAAAARAVRRPHHQLAARRGRRAGRLRRRRAGRPAADRRAAVQRLRRDRIQSARQQRRQDSLPVGRQRADGRAHAVGRTAPRGSLPLAEHRSLVLPDARAENRRAVDAARRARRCWRRPSPIPIPVLFYEHIALYRDPRIKQALSDAAPGPDSARPCGARAGRATIWPSSRTAPTCTWRGGSPTGWLGDGIEASVLDLRTLVPARPRGAAGRGTPVPQGAHRARGFAHRRGRREPGGASSRKRRSSGSTRRSGSSAPSTRPCPTRRRSRSSICRARRRSSARPGCSPRIEPNL